MNYYSIVETFPTPQHSNKQKERRGRREYKKSEAGEKGK